MKKFHFVFLSLVLLFSCSDESLQEIEDSNKSLDNTSLVNSVGPESLIKTTINGDSVTLVKRKGQLFLDGDILVEESDFNNPNTRSAGLWLSHFRWTNNIIYYSFNSTITREDKVIIENAIEHWRKNTHVMFLARTNQTNYVEFTYGNGNWSSIGMRGGKQILSLYKGGFDMGVVVHELGHAVGLFHEQSRNDRDNYITIHWNNILESAKYNFEKYDNGKDLGAFDFNSVMMYSAYSFTVEYNRPTITKKDGTIYNNQQEVLSKGDITGVLAMYPLYLAKGKAIPADYDGDGKVDLAVYNDEIRVWFIDYAKNGFGKWDAVLYMNVDSSSIPAPADYDGDGKVDLGLKSNSGIWYIDYAKNGFGKWDASYAGYGNGSEFVVPADYDGDGKADLALKSFKGTWSIDYAKNGFGKWDVSYDGYGKFSEQVVPADYDGDGKVDLALKSNSGIWYIDYAKNGFGKWDVSYSGYGNGYEQAVPADYDGDGKIDLALKSNSGIWYIDYANNGFGKWDFSISGYGGAADQAVPADYDGDGRADFSLNAANGMWYIDYANNGFGKWDWNY